MCYACHSPLYVYLCVSCFFFFQAEDGIRDTSVTGVQTCSSDLMEGEAREPVRIGAGAIVGAGAVVGPDVVVGAGAEEIGRASWRERGGRGGGGGGVGKKRRTQGKGERERRM